MDKKKLESNTNWKKKKQKKKISHSFFLSVVACGNMEPSIFVGSGPEGPSDKKKQKKNKPYSIKT